MIRTIGNIQFNLESDLSKDEFFNAYQGKLRGIDIKDAWREYSYYKRKLKKK